MYTQGMDQKVKESTCERVLTKEREFEDDCYIHIVLFTAGIALLMACFKRALMVFLLEEWRLWVFLFLNLVLLSILFTSTLSTPKEESKESKRDNGVDQELKKNHVERSKKIKGQSSSKEEEQVTLLEREDNKSEDLCDKKISGAMLSSKSSGGVDVKVSCKEDDQMEAPRLSKEELNERAEAFIVMFRQHLVLDARKCGKQYLFERSERDRVERVKFQTYPK